MLYIPKFHNEQMWWGWLRRGFEEINHLNEDVDLNPGRVKFLYPMMLRNNDTPIIWDFSDFVSFTQPELRHKRFKIQLLQESPLGKPIAQVCAKPEYEDFRIKTLSTKADYTLDVIGMFRATNYETRLAWLEIVRGMKIRSRLALWDSPGRPEAPSYFNIQKLDYYDHLNLAYNSKIGLAIPGIGQEEGSTWSFRHSELLGLGVMVIMPRTKLLYPGDTRGCWIECDTHELEGVINYYLTHEHKRIEIAQNGLKYYEKYIKPSSMAQYILDNV